LSIIFFVGCVKIVLGFEIDDKSKEDRYLGKAFQGIVTITMLCSLSLDNTTSAFPDEKIPVFASEASFREKWRRKEARSASSGERPYLFLQKE